jgi:hypothetical protein
MTPHNRRRSKGKVSLGPVDDTGSYIRRVFGEKKKRPGTTKPVTGKKVMASPEPREPRRWHGGPERIGPPESINPIEQIGPPAHITSDPRDGQDIMPPGGEMLDLVSAQSIGGSIMNAKHGVLPPADYVLKGGVYPTNVPLSQMGFVGSPPPAFSRLGVAQATPPVRLWNRDTGNNDQPGFLARLFSRASGLMQR